MKIRTAMLVGEIEHVPCEFARSRNGRSMSHMRNSMECTTVYNLYKQVVFLIEHFPLIKPEKSNDQIPPSNSIDNSVQTKLYFSIQQFRLIKREKSKQSI